jgi:hypothetical protein
LFAVKGLFCSALFPPPSSFLPFHVLGAGEERVEKEEVRLLVRVEEGGE